MTHLFFLRFFLLPSIDFVFFLLLFSFFDLRFFAFLDLRTRFQICLIVWSITICDASFRQDRLTDLVFSLSESLSIAVAKAVTPARACSKLLCAGAMPYRFRLPDVKLIDTSDRLIRDLRHVPNADHWSRIRIRNARRKTQTGIFGAWWLPKGVFFPESHVMHISELVC